jgi:hypothetical protein
LTYVATRGATSFARSQAPAARELKRPNGHKVQLALKRDIEDLRSQLERQRKATDAASNRIFQLENRVLAVSADRDGWRAVCARNAKFIGELERMLGLSTTQKSWDERQEQLIEVIAVLQAQAQVVTPNTDEPAPSR